MRLPSESRSVRSIDGSAIFSGTPGKPAPQPIVDYALRAEIRRVQKREAVVKMKLGNLLRLCDGGQIHDLIFFQQQRTKPRERIELRRCQDRFSFGSRRSNVSFMAYLSSFIQEQNADRAGSAVAGDRAAGARDADFLKILIA